MDLTQLCRLCLESDNDLLDIFESFENLTIASIIERYFRFEVYDCLSNYLCKECWTNTKNFHCFYQKIELLQKEYFQSIEDDKEQEKLVKIESDHGESVTTSSEYIVTNEIDASLTHVYDVKSEDVEISEQVIALQVQHDKSMDNDDVYDSITVDESDDDQNEELAQSLDDEQFINNFAQLSGIHKDVSVIQNENSTKSIEQLTNRKKMKSQEDDQIREFFNMECEICCDQFETFVKAKNHYRIIHGTTGYLTCCGKKFHRRGRILQHIHRHLNPDAYKCDPCGKYFADKFALKNHIENHESIYTRAYKCNLCSSSFTKPSKLAQHERLRHCSEEDKKFTCDKCNKNFVSKSVLASHVRGVHEFAFAHVCDICARVFKSKHVFKNHMQEHSTTIRPKMQCNVCGAWLKHEESLRKHLKRHQDTFANCPICNKVLQNKHSLGNHIRNVHGERSHQCTMCDKAFKKAIVLKEHMALHTGEDLYKCPYCTKTFKSGANMHAHRKKAHFSEWTRDRLKRFTPMSVE